ncbi:MAG: hypothetical protein E7592_01625 [Ruminococcaceae bacterium]|nr:hypothetical protein [Oscillospiraceae bacterium]
MKKPSKITVIYLSVFLVILTISTLICPRFIFLSPSCYSDNKDLIDQENYFIKKIVLEAIEDRLSIFSQTENDIYSHYATENEIIQLDNSQKNNKHIFIWINTDFMQSVEKRMTST